MSLYDPIRYEWNPLWQCDRFVHWWEAREARLIERRLSQVAWLAKQITLRASMR